MINQMTRQEIEEKLIAKAWQDSSFKQELLSNPKSVLEKEGISLPQNIEVQAVEENTNTYYIIIPSQPNSGEELSEAELEAVAGGYMNYDCNNTKPAAC
jgi:Nitrile hydratase, alpha chain